MKSSFVTVVISDFVHILASRYPLQSAAVTLSAHDATWFPVLAAEHKAHHVSGVYGNPTSGTDSRPVKDTSMAQGTVKWFNSEKWFWIHRP